MGTRPRGRTCRGKACYRSYAQAEKTRTRRQKECREPLRIYVCHVCGLYHLTSQEQR